VSKNEIDGGLGLANRIGDLGSRKVKVVVHGALTTKSVSGIVVALRADVFLGYSHRNRD